MKHFVVLLGLLLGIRGFSQTSDPHIACNSFESIAVTPTVVMNGTVQKEYIKKSDLVQYGLQIGLADTTFRIIGFKALYDCHSGLVMDVNERTYIGSGISSEDHFIQGLRIGDQFILDCINVEKAGKRYLISGVVLDVIE